MRQILVQKEIYKMSGSKPVPRLCFSLLFYQGAFLTLRLEDLWHRPNFFVGVAASFSVKSICGMTAFQNLLTLT